MAEFKTATANRQLLVHPLHIQFVYRHSLQPRDAQFERGRKYFLHLGVKSRQIVQSVVTGPELAYFKLAFLTHFIKIAKFRIRTFYIHNITGYLRFIERGISKIIDLGLNFLYSGWIFREQQPADLGQVSSAHFEQHTVFWISFLTGCLETLCLSESPFYNFLYSGLIFREKQPADLGQVSSAHFEQHTVFWISFLTGFLKRSPHRPRRPFCTRDRTGNTSRTPVPRKKSLNYLLDVDPYCCYH
ncbi:cAMP-regulated phosphoprotein 19-related protein [Striga asiatica]|uniref:cAMP-regulated phosphoprotein 19-related protein n=1 Tax=Striga asiatica TaxID=4170 RepID=A0A5A7PNB0_STRAF|nr:cAMP-regulated phosphoprotein 19-related protein [Striga asiatica]